MCLLVVAEALWNMLTPKVQGISTLLVIYNEIVAIIF